MDRKFPYEEEKGSFALYFYMMGVLFIFMSREANYGQISLEIVNLICEKIGVDEDSTVYGFKHDKICAYTVDTAFNTTLLIFRMYLAIILSLYA